MKISTQPIVKLIELVEAVNDLRKRLDWALDEVARANRIIQHSNTLTAEWDRLGREREQLIAELRKKLTEQAA